MSSYIIKLGGTEGGFIIMGKRKTHEIFVEEVKAINNNIEILGRYTRRIDKIECRCKIDGFKWNPVAYSLLDGRGCPKCGNKVKSLKLSKTHDKFIEEMERLNPNICVIGEYVNVKTKIEMSCKICNTTWNANPNDLIQGSGCPKCGDRQKHLRQKKSTKQFIGELYEINKDIKIHSEYINNRTNVKCSCNICGEEWETLPNSLLLRVGCPECGKITSGIKRRVTHEDFKQKLHKINSNIKVMSKYTKSVEKVKCKCNICGWEWKAKPNGLLNGYGCPRCKASKGERNISDILDKHNIKFIPQYKFEGCKDKKLLLFDFYLPSEQTVIEFDGRQHYHAIDFFGGAKGLKATQRRDNIKNEYCKNNNIKLIRIPYNIKNIEEYLIKSIS